MKTLINIFNFCINSSIWVAITVSALVAITYYNFEIELNETVLKFVFLGTVFGYNFIKYFEEERLSDIKSMLVKLNFSTLIEKFKNLKIQEKLTFFISAVSLICCMILVFRLQIMTLLILLIPVVLSFFYARSFGYKTLRNISGLKIYVVAVVWAFVTVLIPIIESEINMSADVWLTFSQRFLFVVVLILPFEIRDLSVDDEKLKTLPQKIGLRKTKLFGVLLLSLFFVLEFLKDELLVVNILILSVLVLITALFLVRATTQQSKYYASFFVEGIPVFWLLLLLVL